MESFRSEDDVETIFSLKATCLFLLISTVHCSLDILVVCFRATDQAMGKLLPDGYSINQGRN